MSRYVETDKKKVRTGLLVGAQKLSQIVGVTYGPFGRNVIIDKKYATPTVTKDGISVAKEVFLDDPIQSMGAEILKEAANRVADFTGDGTTTTILLSTEILLLESYKDVPPFRIASGLEKALNRAIEILHEKLSRKITTPNEVYQVAMISSNGDEEIAELISKAYEKTGHATIMVSKSKHVDTEVIITQGMELNRGWIAPQFVNDAKEMQWKKEDVRILIYDGEISSIQPLVAVLNYLNAQAIPILIVAHNVEDPALATLLTNALTGRVHVCCVKSPMSGEKRDLIMEDLAILTGGIVISEKTSTKLEDLGVDGKREQFLGTAKSVCVKRDTCTISGGLGKEEFISLRVEQVKNLIKEDWENAQFHEARLARLIGGISEIKVGAYTDVEMLQKMDRVEDAVCAVKAALEDGISPGAGSSYFYIGQELTKESSGETDWAGRLAYELLGSALKRPMDILFTNASLKAPKDLPEPEDNDLKTRDPLEDQMGFLLARGITDPTRVIESCMTAAVSAATMLITSGGIITPSRGKEDPINEIKSR